MTSRAWRGDIGMTDPRGPRQDAKLAWTRQGPARPKEPATARSCFPGRARLRNGSSPRADFFQDFGARCRAASNVDVVFQRIGSYGAATSTLRKEASLWLGMNLHRDISSKPGTSATTRSGWNSTMD